MTHVRHEHRHLTVACDLDVADLKTRAAEWQVLRDSYGLSAEAIPGGTRLWLRADAESVAESLVQQEAQCCGFLDFEMTSQGERVRLDVTSLAPEGAQVAAFLAGIDPDPSLLCC
ncbi:MAG TPA: hypothetical protein VMU49_01270 [Candidatus Acidoferrales bacterium]|nr:hypothetical protein [Candidatus Acidoferrales bacterium]